jgi:hypothetical protein
MELLTTLTVTPIPLEIVFSFPVFKKQAARTSRRGLPAGAEFQEGQKGRLMDSIRSISVTSVAQLMVLGAMTPAIADLADDDDHRRHHGRTHHHAVSHSRADYPVIWNWLASPQPTEQLPERG